METSKPKKHLGQNFLTDESVIRKIIALAELRPDDAVLEVGPGRGILTESLAAQCREVVAVEIDRTLIPVLQRRFEGNKRIGIVPGDILKLDPGKLVAGKYKLIANLPYYITSPIIRKFLEASHHPSEMILMVQKEVAERICASPGEMSILAVSVQYYAAPEILFEVPRTAFDPVPEVDSAVIRIAQIHKRSDAEREVFFRVVRAGFCAKRKTLANNLANSFHLERRAVEEKLAGAGIKPAARAQELSVDEWKALALVF